MKVCLRNVKWILKLFDLINFSPVFLCWTTRSSVAVFNLIGMDEFYSFVFFLRSPVDIDIFDLFWGNTTLGNAFHFNDFMQLSELNLYHLADLDIA